MENEKMIEEMTENGLCCIACEMCDETLENGKFVKAECLESGHTNNCSISKHVAEAFIDAGYRKVPDGAVMLTKEELIKLNEKGFTFTTTTGVKINIIELTRVEARRETAMEILNDIFSDVHRIEIGSNQYVLTEKDKKRIAKKFSVALEE